jgi:hypothetical protein
MEINMKFTRHEKKLKAMNNAHMRMINLHVFLCTYDEEIKERKNACG